MLKSVAAFQIREESASPFRVLTRRERDVLPYVTRGAPNKVIAAELGVSQRTIEAHRARIFEKMCVRNAVELTHRYLQWQMAADEVALRLAEPIGWHARGSPAQGAAAQAALDPGVGRRCRPSR